MNLDRRNLLKWSGATAGLAAVALPSTTMAAPISAYGIDAGQLGLRPGSPDDQTQALQRAIDQTAAARTSLALPPGTYHVNELHLPTGAQLIGVRGATRFVSDAGDALFVATGTEHVTLSGLVLDGAKRTLPAERGLITIENSQSVRIVDCEIAATGGTGIRLVAVEGEVSGNTLGDCDAAIFSLNARGLLIARNAIRGASNNGIMVWRSESGDDGTMVLDNRIEAIENRSGGSGQYGNAVNVFRAGNVIVRGNHMRNCAFTAVRGNAANNLQVAGNSITGMGEVAIYSEFGFEGAVIANNIVDGAALGIAVSNFNQGGRLAVVSGNILRNMSPKRPAGTDPGDGAGIGIGVEADAAVTGNFIENAPTAGITLGWGRYLRDVSVTGNVVRNADVGIMVSVTPGAGSALIADNLISGATHGAIVAMDHRRPVSGDLAKEGAGRFANLAVSGNRVS